MFSTAAGLEIETEISRFEVPSAWYGSYYIYITEKET